MKQPQPPPASGPGSPHCRGFMIILRHTTVGRTTLNDQPDAENSTCQHTTRTIDRQTDMPPDGFELVISASEKQHTVHLDCTATGIGTEIYTSQKTQFLSIRKTNDISGELIRVHCDTHA